MEMVNLVELFKRRGIKVNDYIKLFADGQWVEGWVTNIDQQSVKVKSPKGEEFILYGTAAKGGMKLMLKLNPDTVKRFKVGNRICIDGLHKGKVIANNADGLQLTQDQGSYFKIPRERQDGSHWAEWLD